MKFHFSKEHFRKYRELAKMLIKYGRSDLVHQFGLEEVLEPGERQRNAKEAAKPEELVNDLERMGPTYVKLGQLLSSRPDLMPDAYLRALVRLQDRVKPFPYADVDRIIQAELGVRVSKAFAEFNPEPIAAASLGQVHRARLRDGREVAVKVQRPGIRRQVADDIEVIGEIAGFLSEHTKLGKRYQLLRLFEEFKVTLLHELDYQREASNLATLGKNLEDFPSIYVPRPIDDYTTRSVLTMIYVRGRKITQVSPLIRMEIPGRKLANEFFRAYLRMVLVDGLFHADPHPGNVFLTEDGRIALLDVGMIGRISWGMQEHLLKILIEVSEGDSDEAASQVIRISEVASDFQETEFRRKAAVFMAEQQKNRLSEMQLGKTLLEVARAAGENGLYVPTELTLLGKTLLQLDEIGRYLDPDFNPNKAVRRNVIQIMNHRMRRNLTPGNMFGSLLEMKEFVGLLPGRLNRILEALADAELEVKVRASDASDFMESFTLIANRITAGLVLAALIIGAALLMNVETAFTIFGYPGLAIIFFLTAAGGGLWLVFNILVRDHQLRKRKR